MARTRISIKKHWKKKIRIYFTNWKNNNLQDNTSNSWKY